MSDHLGNYVAAMDAKARKILGLGPDDRLGEGAVFWWWDDALAEARARAVLTGQRFKVKALGTLWRIEVATSEIEEACS